MVLLPPRATLFPYTTLFRSAGQRAGVAVDPQNRGRYFSARLPHDQLPRRLAFRAFDLHVRSEEHTSELQSRGQLVCRLLLEKKNHLSLKAKIMIFAF